MPNAGNRKAPAGQTYHLLLVFLTGYISTRRTNYQNISDHKVSKCIRNNNHLYAEWRDAVKDHMLARCFRKIRTFPDHHFQHIVAGMRALRPACDSLVTAAAANNRARMRQIDEAVVQLVKDCWVKLRTTVKNRSTGLAPYGHHGIFYDQIMLRDQLLPPNAPDHWGPATTVPNLGPVTQNVPPAYTPQMQNLPTHHGNYVPQAQVVPAENVPDHHRNYPPPWQNVPAQHWNYGPLAQGVPAHGVLAQGVLAQGVPAQNYLIIMGITHLIIMGITHLRGKTYLHILRFTLPLVKIYQAFLPIMLFRVKAQLPCPPITLLLIH